jgi:hypothetical protein
VWCWEVRACLVYVPAGGRADEGCEQVPAAHVEYHQLSHVLQVLAHVPPDLVPAYPPARHLLHPTSCRTPCRYLPPTFLPSTPWVGLTKLSACEFVPYGIRANAVAPGQLSLQPSSCCCSCCCGNGGCLTRTLTPLAPAWLAGASAMLPGGC